MSEMDAGFSFEEPVGGWEPEDSMESFPPEGPGDPMPPFSDTGETYASSYLQEIAEADLPTSGSDTDQDGVLHMVPTDTYGDGLIDMTERDGRSSLPGYDGDGDGDPAVRPAGTPAADFADLPFDDGTEAVQDLPQALPPPPTIGSETAIVAGGAVESDPQMS